MSVKKKLLEARVKFLDANIKKTGKNEYAGYDYYELGDYMPTITKICNEIGIIGLVSFTSELATLRIEDVDSDEYRDFTSPMGSAALKGCYEVQNIGAVETYQRRYLWQTAFDIVESDAVEKSQKIDFEWISDEFAAHKTLKALQDDFTIVYRSASAEDKPKIKSIYDKHKAKFEAKA